MGKLDNPENPAGVKAGLADKSPIKAPEKQLSMPDADYDGSAKQTRKEKDAGGGFTWK